MLIESAIAFGGLIIGLILAYFTKDELKSGKKYFHLLERVLLLVLVILLLYETWDSFIFLIISFVAGFMVFMGISRVYLYLGFALFLSFAYSQTFAYIFVGVIFLLGLTYGALEYGKKMTMFVVSNLIFFGVPFILLLFEPFIVSYDFIFFPFVAGALFAKFLLRG
ncbi:MAG: hypothetical protein ABIH25_04300 [Candidatus Woesearchaeota archaeon]